MEPGDEAAPVNPAAAGCPVAEPDYIGTVLAKTIGESESLGVVSEWNESSLAVAITAHENCEFTAWGQNAGTVADGCPVAFKEFRQFYQARPTPDWRMAAAQ
jgi:hypothetical protein